MKRFYLFLAFICSLAATASAQVKTTLDANSLIKQTALTNANSDAIILGLNANATTGLQFDARLIPDAIGSGGGSSGHADNADYATNAGHADFADGATEAATAFSAGHADSADSATFAATCNIADVAGSATNAGHATTADTAVGLNGGSVYTDDIDLHVTGILWANILEGDGTNITNLTASQLVGAVPYGNLPVGNVANTVARGDDPRFPAAAATTVGANLFTLTNPGAVTFLRINADNSVTALSASAMRTALSGAASGANTDITSLTAPTINPASVLSLGGSGNWKALNASEIDLYTTNGTSRSAYMADVGAGLRIYMRIGSALGFSTGTDPNNADTFILQDATGRMKVTNGNYTTLGDWRLRLLSLDGTTTPSGTSGSSFTINKAAGSVRVPAGASTVTVADSLVTATSIVAPMIASNDATASIKNYTRASGTFTINLAAAATAETEITFVVFSTN